MPKTRKVYVLTKDIKNTDSRARTGALRDMPELFMEGEVFVHEVVVPQSKSKRVYDALLFVDDEDVVAFAFEKGTTMYDKLWKNLRRAKPGMGRLVHEYDAYLPHTISELLSRIVSSGLITLRQLEDTLIQYRRDNDYDMLSEDDTVMLPKPGRSKLDAEEGRTDPVRADYDPDMSHYVAPDAEPEDQDDDEEAIREAAEAEVEAETESATGGPYATWITAVDALLIEHTGKSISQAGVTSDELQSEYAEKTDAEAMVDFIIDAYELEKPEPKAKPKSKKKAKAKPKAKPKSKAKAAPKTVPQTVAGKEMSDLADAVYEVLAQTPGKTRRLDTLAEMTGAKTSRDVFLALDVLYKAGRVDDKGRAIIKGK